MTEEGKIEKGSIVVNDYVIRTATVLAVYEHEVSHLALLNTQVTGLCSFSASFASIAFSIWLSSTFTTTPTEAAKMVTTYGVPLFIALAVVCAVLALFVGLSRRGILDSIKSQSTSPKK